MKKFSLLCAVLMLGCTTQSASTAQKQKKDTRPNIVFVFPDQMRGTLVGAFGKEPVKTPNLDAFSRESVVFTQAASNYPLCSPYRAMLMSGQYPTRNGVFSNCTSLTEPFGCELAQNTVCWTDVLRNQGYATAYIGKWHLDSPKKPYIQTRNNLGRCAWNEFTPKERRHGNDFWYAYGTYDDHLNPMYWATDSTREQWQFAHEYGPDHEVKKAVEFLDSRPKDRPFSMVISMNPPHPGHNLLPRKYLEMYKDVDMDAVAKSMPCVDGPGTNWGNHFRTHAKKQYAQVTSIDDAFGRLLDALKERGLDQNTIVIFTSDHGDCIGMHKLPGKNNFYDAAMHVPLMIRYPGKLKPAQTPMLISTPDLYPTMLGLMNLDKQIPASVQGVNYAPTLLNGKFKGADAQLYMRWVDDKWLENPQTPPEYPLVRGLRTARYTYAQDGKNVFLFDRQSDPYQVKNIAAENPDLCKKFAAKMKKEWEKIK